jgi:hypothetical protein
MGETTTLHEPCATGASVETRLHLGWSKLPAAQRTAVLEELGRNMPEWMAESLLRAGVPLGINPGLAVGSTLGEFLVPPECRAFVERKRLAAVALPPKRFWQRRATS